MNLPLKHIVFVFSLFFILKFLSAQTPIASYPFSGNANDVSGNSFNGTVNNATLTTDRFNQSNSAYYFNGSNASIAISYASAFNFSPTGQFTISLWVQPQDANSLGAMFVKSPYNSNYVASNWDYGLYLISNKAMSGYANNNFLNGTTTMTALSCWYHVVVTYNNAIWRLYVNGVLEAQDNSGTKSITQSTGGLCFGKKGEANGDFFKGKLDELKVYNTSLTSLQVSELYQSSSSVLSMSSKNIYLCYGDSVQFFSTGGGTYLWTPAAGLSNSTINNPYASPLVSTQYKLEVTNGSCVLRDTINVYMQQCPKIACSYTDLISKPNLVLNPDFQQGNTGFSTDYSFSTANPLSGGNYNIVADAATIHFGYSGYDHTSGNGTGKFMVINGASLAVNDWCQTVAVQKNKYYRYAAWFKNIVKKPQYVGLPIANVELHINGQKVSNNIGLPDYPDVWVKLDTLWYSGNSTSVTLCIYDTSTSGNGNDFAIDDISFKLCDCAATANAGPDVYSCKKDFVQLNGTGNGSAFTWSPIKFINNNIISNPIVNPDTTVSYVLMVSNGVCVAYDTMNVFVTSIDDDILNNDTAICLGDTVRFITAINGNNFYWNPTKFLNDSNSSTPKVNPDTTTKYYLTVTRGTCVKKDSVTINVIKNIIANAGSDQQICKGNSVQLSANGPPGSVFSWLPNYALSNNSISNPIADPAFDTSYFLKIKLGNNCVGYDTVKIIVNPNPMVDAGLDKDICREPFVTIGVSSIFADSFYWSPSTGLSNINILQTQASPTSNTKYFIKAINKNTSCFNYDTVNVTMIKPIASFNSDLQIGQVPFDVHFTNTSTNAKNYFWNFGDTTAISILVNPSHIYNNEGLYKVILVAENNGCTDTAEAIIQSTGGLIVFIPNAFTVNNDGLNDEFVISYTQANLKKMHGTIWNRWGEKIYEFEMPGGKWWDGKVNENFVQTDTYFYTIEATDFTNRTQTFKGNFTLLR